MLLAKIYQAKLRYLRMIFISGGQIEQVNITIHLNYSNEQPLVSSTSEFRDGFISKQYFAEENQSSSNLRDCNFRIADQQVCLDLTLLLKLLSVFRGV